MVYTLYDDLMNKKYFITEASRNGFPKGNYYNNWVMNNILRLYLLYDENQDLLKGGVYSLSFDNLCFYIGRTNRSLILRGIDHLFDTIPNPKSDIKSCNNDKVMFIRTLLILDRMMYIKRLSSNPDEEEKIIKSKQSEKGFALVNKQFCDNSHSYEELMFIYFSMLGYRYGNKNKGESYTVDDIHSYFVNKYSTLKRIPLNIYDDLEISFLDGYKIFKDNEEE